MTSAAQQVSPIGRLVLALATALVILGVSLLVLLSPIDLHPALDYAGSARILGLPPAEVHRLSDLTVSEVVLGPGTFAFPAPGSSAPFFDPSEASHMRDVRVVLWGFLALVALGAVVLVLAVLRRGRSPSTWRAIGRGGALLAVGFAVVGLVGLVAFDPLFELFHRVFFPGGNWAFDPRTQRLVQLYPFTFWQLTGGLLAALSVVGGLLVRAYALGRAERVERQELVERIAADRPGQTLERERTSVVAR